MYSRALRNNKVMTDKLKAEIYRNHELHTVLTELPAAIGTERAEVLAKDIAEAEKALEAHDTVRMMQMYEILKGNV